MTLNRWKHPQHQLRKRASLPGLIGDRVIGI
jgi:hypothetical protein